MNESTRKTGCFAEADHAVHQDGGTYAILTNAAARLRIPAILLLSAMVLCASVFVSGCADPSAPKKLPPRYADRGLRKDLPSYLKGTIYELADLEDTDPIQISGWGLVANLRDTGDSTAPVAVRQFMIKHMVRHGFGTTFVQKYRNVQPEAILRDPRVAIVRVDALIPPGARANQRTDALVTCLPGNNTTSLAHGRLYATDLKIDGANPIHPEGNIHVMAQVGGGAVFVNPVYASGDPSTAAGAGARNSSVTASLRNGVVMNGAAISQDRPLVLRIRTPQYSLSRTVERVIEQYFQSDRNDLAQYHAARAQDEAIVWIYVPQRFRGDWRHFAGLVTHLYINDTPAMAVRRAQELAEAATTPGAPLMDISYALEGIGKPALPFIMPLLSAKQPPAVRYAAARAAALIGDASAQQVLLAIAHQTDNPFRINAVQTLGAVTPTPEVRDMMRGLLDSEQAMVRVAAYEVLARDNDASIYSRQIEDKFMLDYMPGKGPPMVYATRTGIPRIAIFGGQTSVPTPVTYTAMNSRFSLSAAAGGDTVTLYYREQDGAALQQQTRDNLSEIIARLAGSGPPGQPRFDMSYGDIVGILQGLAQQQLILASADTHPQNATFVLQDMPASLDPLMNVPIIGDSVGRPIK